MRESGILDKRSPKEIARKFVSNKLYCSENIVRLSSDFPQYYYEPMGMLPIGLTVAAGCAQLK